mgnify:CR=1 FL=1
MPDDYGVENGRWARKIINRKDVDNVRCRTNRPRTPVKAGRGRNGRWRQEPAPTPGQSVQGAIAAGTPLGKQSLGIDGINIGTQAGAQAAVDVIKAAINTVSSVRGTLGATQNRLEHTINNLDNVVENTTSAESAIRDTDMATEMVKYSNNNILSQAGQAMLAQANQSNQGVLSLLQ